MSIDIHNCKSVTGYDYIDLIAVTGVFGVHKRFEFLDLAGVRQLRYSIFYNVNGVLTIEITSPAISILRVHVLNKDELYVDLFRLQQGSKGANIGFKRMIKQIEEAVRLGFKRISLWAFGDFSQFPLWDGYIVWGKYGFTMYEPDEINKFNLQMIDERLPHCTTVNILVSTKEGTALWKHIGESWEGEFYLDSRSDNMKLYTQYGKDRKLF